MIALCQASELRIADRACATGRGVPVVAVEGQPEQDLVGWNLAGRKACDALNPVEWRDGARAAERPAVFVSHDGDQVCWRTQRGVVVGAGPADGDVALLGRNGKGQQLAIGVQRLAGAGHKRAERVAIGGVDALQVEIEAVVVLRHGVAHDLVQRICHGALVGEDLVIDPGREGQQGRQDLQVVVSRELLERLIVAAAEVAATVDGDPLCGDHVEPIRVRLQ